MEYCVGCGKSDPYSRGAALRYHSPEGYEKRLNVSPCNAVRTWFGEEILESLARLPAHRHRQILAKQAANRKEMSIFVKDRYIFLDAVSGAASIGIALCMIEWDPRDRLPARARPPRRKEKPSEAAPDR